MSNSKAKSKTKPPASGPSTYAKPYSNQQQDKTFKSTATTNTTATTNQQKNKSAINFDNEIDSLFASKKQSTKMAKLESEQQQRMDREERHRKKMLRLQEEADELALRGVGVTTAKNAKGGGDNHSTSAATAAPRALHAQALKLKSLSYTRSDLTALNDACDGLSNSNKNNTEHANKWASDGLGGIFNGEGYTGRKDEGGHRVFKAHLMNKEGFGMSKDCPFDCDCCYI
ncbi:hypothetical protein ACHAXN_010255 [Cyclotella atomus]